MSTDQPRGHDDTPTPTTPLSADALSQERGTGAPPAAAAAQEPTSGAGAGAPSSTPRTPADGTPRQGSDAVAAAGGRERAGRALSETGEHAIVKGPAGSAGHGGAADPERGSLRYGFYETFGIAQPPAKPDSLLARNRRDLSQSPARRTSEPRAAASEAQDASQPEAAPIAQREAEPFKPSKASSGDSEPSDPGAQDVRPLESADAADQGIEAPGPQETAGGQDQAGGSAVQRRSLLDDVPAGEPTPMDAATPEEPATDEEVIAREPAAPAGSDSSAAPPASAPVERAGDGMDFPDLSTPPATPSPGAQAGAMPRPEAEPPQQTEEPAASPSQARALAAEPLAARPVPPAVEPPTGPDGEAPQSAPTSAHADGVHPTTSTPAEAGPSDGLASEALETPRVPAAPQTPVAQPDSLAADPLEVPQVPAAPRTPAVPQVSPIVQGAPHAAAPVIEGPVHHKEAEHPEPPEHAEYSERYSERPVHADGREGGQAPEGADEPRPPHSTPAAPEAEPIVGTPAEPVSALPADAAEDPSGATEAQPAATSPARPASALSPVSVPAEDAAAPALAARDEPEPSAAMAAVEPRATAPATASPSTASLAAAEVRAGAASGSEAAEDEEARAQDPSSRPASRSSASERDILLEGATALEEPESRAAAHWAGVLLAIALFPVAWFLVRDGANTLTGGDATAWPASTSALGLLELGGGALVFCLAAFMAHRSSLGTFVVGAIGLVIGLPFILAPGVVASVLGPTVERLQAHSSLGEALATYAMADGLTGSIALLGLFMIMLGVVSHSARRAGRREQRAQDDAETHDR